MTSFELIKALLKRLKKFSWLILIFAIGGAAGFYVIAKRGIPIYSSRFTVFPLNSSTDNSLSNSTISNILGLSDAPKSFSGDASINIIELATSRRTREAVASATLTTYNNKTIAELLINENNKNIGFMKNTKIKTPTDSNGLINVGSEILKGGFAAKINKNGLLEMSYANANTDLVKNISYIFVDKISSFYVELKKQKAQLDFEFAVRKADSLKKVMDGVDAKQIYLQEHSYFTNDELKRNSLPKLNLEQEKQAIQQQYFYAVNNRENAAYKLQKETPIIQVLDKPEGPYTATQKSTMLLSIIGGVLGLLLGIVLVSWKIISRYFETELNKVIEKAEQKSKEQAANTETAKQEQVKETITS